MGGLTLRSSWCRGIPAARSSLLTTPTLWLPTLRFSWSLGDSNPQRTGILGPQSHPMCYPDFSTSWGNSDPSGLLSPRLPNLPRLRLRLRSTPLCAPAESQATSANNIKRSRFSKLLATPLAQSLTRSSLEPNVSLPPQWKETGWGFGSQSQDWSQALLSCGLTLRLHPTPGEIILNLPPATTILFPRVQEEHPEFPST